MKPAKVYRSSVFETRNAEAGETRDLGHAVGARRTRAEGKVYLRLLVDEKGDVAAIEVAAVEGPSLFGEEAKKAARAWTYSPALKDGVAVKTWVNEKIVFKP